VQVALLWWRLAFRSSFGESLPRYTLLFPVWHDRNCTDFAFAESGDWVGGGFEVEDRTLDARGEIGEVDDLRYADAGTASDSSDIGVVFDLACGE
jgi:hypothetical protein